MTTAMVIYIHILAVLLNVRWEYKGICLVRSDDTVRLYTYNDTIKYPWTYIPFLQKFLQHKISASTSVCNTLERQMSPSRRLTTPRAEWKCKICWQSCKRLIDTCILAGRATSTKAVGRSYPWECSSSLLRILLAELSAFIQFITISQ